MNINSFIAGFIAGEGCFATYKRLNKDYFTFIFAVGVHKRDLDMLNLIKTKLGGGSINFPKKRPNMCTYRITVSRNNWHKVILFFDRYLTHSYKRQQYLKWKSHLVPVVKSRIKEKKKQIDKQSAIRKLKKNGLSYTQIAKRFNLTRQRVCYLANHNFSQ